MWPKSAVCYLPSCVVSDMLSHVGSSSIQGKFCFFLTAVCGHYMHCTYRGVIPGGAGGGGAQPPQLLANNIFFVLSHTTDRKVPSEVVLMSSLCQSDMVMSAKTGIVQLKISRIMT